MNAPHAVCAVTIVSCFFGAVRADGVPCLPDVPCVVDEAAASAPPSWIFRRSTFTHDPYTGARVAQYMRTPPVEPLDDERNFTSRYRRSRLNVRGHDGSSDTYYEVQAWGVGRGGIDAEWERFHDAWKESILSGGYYNFNQGGGYGPWQYGGGYPAGGYAPGYGFPGYGYPAPGYPGQGYGPPWYGGPPHGGHHGSGYHGEFNDKHGHD
jgi:hypothetical protein